MVTDVLREVASAAARLPTPVSEGRVIPPIAHAAEAGVEERAVLPVCHSISGAAPHPFPVRVIAATGGGVLGASCSAATAVIANQTPSPEEGRLRDDDGEREEDKQNGGDWNISSTHGMDLWL